MKPNAWSFVPDALRFDVPGLRGMSWTRIGGLFGVALGFAVFSLSGQIIRAGEWPWIQGRDFMLDAANWFVRYLIDFAPVLLALTLADNLPFRGARRVAALAVALVVGAQFQWPILCACGQGYDFAAFPWRSWTEMLWEHTVWTMVYCTPIALTYFYRRRDQHVAKALHDAEVARTELQRRILEAELHTMQARVEPSFLFDTLGDVGELYDREPAAGERMLDELISYLRAALPDADAAGSTLQQEAALAHAFLAILQFRMQGRFAFKVRIPEEMKDAPIPPVILVPILAAGIGPESASEVESSVQLAAIMDAANVRVVIIGRGPAMRVANEAQTVRDIRERLRLLYGDRATLRIDAEIERRLTVVLEIPGADA